ncbi:hypothetical protein CHU98_g12216, partial [Xylaria longipes]
LHQQKLHQQKLHQPQLYPPQPYPPQPYEELQQQESHKQKSHQPQPYQQQEPHQQPSNTGYGLNHVPGQRVILDTNGYFYYDEVVPPPAMKLSQFVLTFPNGNLEALRPVPDPAAIKQVEENMKGSGNSWAASKFTLAKVEFIPQNVQTLGSNPVRRYCVHEKYVSPELPLETMLIFTDAVVVHAVGDRKGKDVGGCAFRFSDSPDGTVAFCLEARGATGSYLRPATRYRTAFRAIVAALRFKDWYREG